MSICSGKTKTGTNCTKRIKLTETYCYLHKTQSNETEIKVEVKTEIKKEIKSEVKTPKLKVLTAEEIIVHNNTLKIWTWNINSVRNKMDLVDKLLIKHDIDILFLTETKIQPKLETELNFNDSYHTIWNSNKNSYHHGVCFIYKRTLQIELLSDFLPLYIHEDDVKSKVKITKNTDIIEEQRLCMNEIIEKAHNTEGRILTIKCTFNKKEIVVVGTYVPNSGTKRLCYRVESWDKDLYSYLLELEKKYENIIWTGDLNTTIFDNDLLNINANIPGTTFEERQNINDFLNKYHWIDAWHETNPKIVKCKERSTWGISNKFPLRLDYVICSPSLKNNIVFSFNDQKYSGSDHIPIGCHFLLNK